MSSKSKHRRPRAQSVDSKVNFQVDVASWNDKNVLKCKTVGDRAGAMVWLTNHTAEYYGMIDQYSEIGLNILTYILSVGGAPSLIVSNNLDVIRIVNGIVQAMLLFIGLCVSIKTWYGFNKRISKHRWVSSAYQALFLDIEKMLQLPEHKREAFHSYYKKIQEKTFKLQQKMPYISPRVVKLYYKTLGTRALSSEILFGDVQQIEINIDENKPLSNEVPSTHEIFAAIKHTESVRHKNYEAELNRYNLGEVVIQNDSELESSTTNPTLAKAKRISDQRRYELERYFINS